MLTKVCPECGERFNLLRWAVGEYTEHVKKCSARHSRKYDLTMATGCRGCPAGCYEGIDGKDSSAAQHGAQHGHDGAQEATRPGP